ncbi:MAG: hypothetical protein IPP51_15280 [Bacteroidetes bacterium]|nr:hypothetical protein [Bacteroidota bacterium]
MRRICSIFLISAIIVLIPRFVSAQSAPKCSKEESEEFQSQLEQSPDDDYYFCLSRVCMLLTADQYDSVAYYLDRSMYGEGKAAFVFPNQKSAELKEFLGNTEFSKLLKFNPEQDGMDAQVPPIPSHDDGNTAAPTKDTINLPDATATTPGTVFVRPPVLELDAATMTDLKSKAIYKSNLFVTSVNDIGNKNNPDDVVQTAVDGCLDLFIRRGISSKIGVSSANKPGNETRFLVRQYLNRIRQLQYDQIKFRGSEYYMVKDFIKGPDGKYYGYVSFKQSFEGVRDGIPVYKDETTKRIKVVIEKIPVIKDGISQDFWDVFLVEVAVEETHQ